MTSRSSRSLVPLLTALAAPFLISCGSESSETFQVGPVGTGSPVGPVSSVSPQCRAAVAPVNLPSSNITIRFRNSSDAPRYLNSGKGCRAVPSTLLPFTLKDSSGKELLWAPVECGSTCEQMLMGTCSCLEDCPVVPVVMIPPGSAYEMTWSGTVLEAIDVPETCPWASCRDTCLRKQAAPTGMLELTSSLWTGTTGCASSPCTCDPGAKHYCLIDQGATVGGEEHVASAKLDYPSGKVVEIVFP